jgi:hypothetical protein
MEECCDYAVYYYGLSCETIESYGYDCSGCECPDNAGDSGCCANCNNTDSCYPNDGECDDGWVGCNYAYGVDCTDCGNCPTNNCDELCGDGNCSWPSENLDNCPEDCQLYDCGDGVCNGTETIWAIIKVFRRPRTITIPT